MKIKNIGLIWGCTFLAFCLLTSCSNPSSITIEGNVTTTEETPAGKVVLNFSDIISGPTVGLGDGLGSGAIVTIWGNQLGSSQADSKIYFKDSLGSEKEMSHLYYWKNANGTLPSGSADLYSYQKMQEIAASIPDSPDGLGEIYIIAGGIKSNSLPFTVRSGNIYHVKNSGNDSTGDGSWTNPLATVSADSNGASSKMSPGDIVYIGDGVEEVNHGSGYKMTAITLKASGTIENQLAMVAYPGAAILAQAENIGIRNFSGASHWVSSKYVVKSGKWVSGSSSTKSVAINTFKGGRLVGNNITDREAFAGADGCAEGQAGAIVGNALGSDQVSGVKVFGNYLHDWGCDATSKFEHTTYF